MAVPDFSQIPKRPLLIAGILLVFGVGGFLIVSNLRGRGQNLEKVTLSFWGIDRASDFDESFRAYKKARPNVEIQYRRVEEDEYETKLTEALAAGEGPDILMIRSRSLPKQKAKLSFAPPAQFGLQKFRDTFPTVSEEDFTTTQGEVYALPLFIDTLALIYNRDVFDRSALAAPPATWEEFQEDVLLLRKTSGNQILQAGAAFGGSRKTVSSAVDLLHLLMIQNGVPMATRTTSRIDFEGEKGEGEQALAFYTQFANPLSELYTWDNEGASAIERFVAGNVAMLFDYHRRLKEIRSKAPFMRVGVAPVPRASGENVVSYPDYWGVGVSKQSRARRSAWDFIIFLGTETQAAEPYLRATARPPALRTLIRAKLEDPELGIFARQALAARSWYEADETKINDIFDVVILDALHGKTTFSRILQRAESEVRGLAGGL